MGAILYFSFAAQPLALIEEGPRESLADLIRYAPTVLNPTEMRRFLCSSDGCDSPAPMLCPLANFAPGPSRVSL